jgi:hypothetical protein
MTHPQVGPGAVRVDGTVAVLVGDEWRVMPPTLDPLAVALRQFIATNPRVCAGCGRYDCECAVYPDPDLHGDLSVFADQEIPF